VTAYDELSMFHDNASEAGLPWNGPPTVKRVSVAVAGDRAISALVWGEGAAEVVLIHGGAQNAHTWDTVALALDRPLVAIDLPGHGHSDWRDGGNYAPLAMVDDVATAVAELAPRAKAVVGMSLGGLTAICLASRYPQLVPKLGIVDVTPGTDHVKAEPIIAFISGPEYFDSFDAILARTIEHNPTRSESSLRRGVLHNARELPDGRWSWRYDPTRSWKIEGAKSPGPQFGDVWAELAEVSVPLTLWRGARSSVVGDDDVEELLRRQPTARVLTVADAGHSIQGDRPLEMARLIAELLG
jgi:pimeloyl-ACP methyl ester carboxylesterase